jgi:hypothetical protein
MTIINSTALAFYVRHVQGCSKRVEAGKCRICHVAYQAAFPKEGK